MLMFSKLIPIMKLSANQILVHYLSLGIIQDFNDYYLSVSHFWSYIHRSAKAIRFAKCNPSPTKTERILESLRLNCEIFAGALRFLPLSSWNSTTFSWTWLLQELQPSSALVTGHPTISTKKHTAVAWSLFPLRASQTRWTMSPTSHFERLVSHMTPRHRDGWTRLPKDPRDVTEIRLHSHGKHRGYWSPTRKASKNSSFYIHN